MPRTLHVTVNPAISAALVDALRETDGVLSVRLQRGISVEPPGDVIAVDVLNRGLHPVVAMLHERAIDPDTNASLTSTTPLSLVSTQHARTIANDVSEATWEEMDAIMAMESNTTPNALFLMAVSGSLATIGIAQNALHLVIAAMVIAPGFEPIVRGTLRAVARGADRVLGWRQLAEAYGALFVGAALTALLLLAFGHDPSGGTASYLPAAVLIEYWTTVSPLGIAVAAVAGAAGAVVVAGNRSVLTGGVMIALALVPSAAITAIGLVSLQLEVAAAGALRWVLEVVAVAVASAVVFAIKRRTVQGGRALT